MRKAFYSLLFAGLLAGCQSNSSQTKENETPASEDFVRISGQDLIQPDGSKLFIKGTNLGNWLNPEGYMFGFNKTNSGRFINEMFCQLVGPDFTSDFWKKFKDNYITRKDIEFIASTGANTIRLPFHYKMFTDEDYMGLTAAQDGFARIDSVVNWLTVTAIHGCSKVKQAKNSSAISGARLPIITKMKPSSWATN